MSRLEDMRTLAMIEGKRLGCLMGASIAMQAFEPGKGRVTWYFQRTPKGYRCRRKTGWRYAQRNAREVQRILSRPLERYQPRKPPRLTRA